MLHSVDTANIKLIKLAIIMDPLDSINIKKDSTYAMIKEAHQRNWQILTCTPHDLYVDNSIPKAIFTEITPNLTTEASNNNWYHRKNTLEMDLRDVSIILLRKDPPFDLEYIYCTYLLDMAQDHGVLVANNPTSVRNNNEKLSVLNYPELTPAYLVTANKQKLLEFITKHQTVVVKPLDGMGGRSIFKIHVGEDNVSVILDTITDYGQKTIMAQKFIPEITKGDKRVLIIDGEPIPFGLARIPAAGEFRGNLAAGASGVAFKLSERDLYIAEQLGPDLKAQGLYFVGIDIIGDYLTEINVTCPTCIQEIDQQCNLNISKVYLDCLEGKIGKR